MRRPTILFVAVVIPAAHALRSLSRAFSQPTGSDTLRALAEQAAAAEADGTVVDVYGSGAWVSSFEADIAAALGKESAIFVTTGVAAQNMALAVHAELPFRNHRTEPLPSFVMHQSSHLQLYEEAAYSQLLGLTPIIAGDARRVLTSADVQLQLSRLASVGSAPTCIVVELPMRELGCVAPPWEDLLELRKISRKFGVPLHLDGARLWEVAPYYEATAGCSLADVAALFDSVYVSFYKGLGAITGAMLAGDAAFIERALPWRRRLGANPYTSFPYALSCRSGYERWSRSFAARWRKLRALAPLLRQAAADEGGALLIVPDDPVCSQCHVHLGAGLPLSTLDAARDAVEAAQGRRVYERLRSANGPTCYSAPPSDAWPPPTLRESVDGSADDSSARWFFEWTLGPEHVDVEDAIFVEAWRAFFRELRG